MIFEEVGKNQFMVVLNRTYAKFNSVPLKNVEVPVEYEENPTGVFGGCMRTADGPLVSDGVKQTFVRFIPDTLEFRRALDCGMREKPLYDRRYQSPHFLRGFVDLPAFLGIEVVAVYHIDKEGKLFVVKEKDNERVDFFDDLS